MLPPSALPRFLQPATLRLAGPEHLPLLAPISLSLTLLQLAPLQLAVGTHSCRLVQLWLPELRPAVATPLMRQWAPATLPTCLPR